MKPSAFPALEAMIVETLATPAHTREEQYHHLLTGYVIMSTWICDSFRNHGVWLYQNQLKYRRKLLQHGAIERGGSMPLHFLDAEC